MLIGVIAALVLVTCLAVAAFVFRTPARVWLHSRYGVRLFGRGGGADDRVYDAFVSYATKDEDFVQQVGSQPTCVWGERNLTDLRRLRDSNDW